MISIPSDPNIDVYELVNSIPVDKLHELRELVEERLEPKLSISELKELLSERAPEILDGRIEGLRSELEDELLELAESRADENAEQEIENGELDDFLYGLTADTIHQGIDF